MVVALNQYCWWWHSTSVRLLASDRVGSKLPYLTTLFMLTCGIPMTHPCDRAHLLVSGACDKTVKVWDLNSGELLHTMEGHTHTVRCVKMLRETAFSSSRDRVRVIKP